MGDSTPSFSISNVQEPWSISVQLNTWLKGSESNVHAVLQLAMTGSKTAVPVGVCPAGMVFGSVIVTLIKLHGELFGRPDGEKVVSLVISHGANTAGVSSRVVPATKDVKLRIGRIE